MSKILSMGYTKGITIKSKNLHINMLMEDILSNLPYNQFVYADLNAGVGRIRGKLGSPLQFLNSIKDHKNITYDIHFCEICTNAMKKLKTNVYQFQNEVKLNHDITFWNDNNEFLYLFSLIRDEVPGLFFSDENGAFPPFHRFTEIGNQEQFKNIDFLFYVSPITIKRRITRSYYKSNTTLTGVPILRLHEYVKLMNRKYWFIRDKVYNDKTGFIILYGTNTYPVNYHHWKSYIDLYDIDSSEGYDILKNNTFTRDELSSGKYDDVLLKVS